MQKKKKKKKKKKKTSIPYSLTHKPARFPDV